MDSSLKTLAVKASKRSRAGKRLRQLSLFKADFDAASDWKKEDSDPFAADSLTTSEGPREGTTENSGSDFP
jgi:hypothetical protein